MLNGKFVISLKGVPRVKHENTRMLQVTLTKENWEKLLTWEYKLKLNNEKTNRDSMVNAVFDQLEIKIDEV